MGFTINIATPTLATDAATKAYVDNERFINGSGFTAGSSTSITLANTPTSGSQHVYLNGVRLSAGAGNDYTISGTTVSLLDKNGSARTFKANDVVLVDYRY